MLSKIRGSDESFRRRMWKRISDVESKEMLSKMSVEEKKKIYLELLKLQHECDLTCLTFDSWDSGREEMKISLLTEQTKVGDLLYMKYKIQKPIFEQAIENVSFKDDKEVVDEIVRLDALMARAKQAHEKQYELDDDQKRVLKKIANKAGKIDKKKVGESGEGMGFDEFKVIETCIFKLEARLLDDLKSE